MKQDAVTVMKYQEMKNSDEYFMKEALKEAKKAFDLGEVPVGCVIVSDGKIIARAHNLREKKHSILAHAEILAIQKANKALNTWKLDGLTLYVNLEPCAMCAGCILQSRIKRLVYACSEPKFGAAGSVVNLLDNDKFNHQVEITSGVLAENSQKLLKDFFQILRQKQ